MYSFRHFLQQWFILIVSGPNRILQTFSLWPGWCWCTGLCLLWKALSFLSLCWSALGRAAHFHKVLFAQQCLKGNASQARQKYVIIKRVHSLRIFGRIQWSLSWKSCLAGMSPRKVKTILGVRFVILFFGSKTTYILPHANYCTHTINC